MESRNSPRGASNAASDALALKTAARILGKNEAALRARIKRGTMPATVRPRASSETGRYRYLIPLAVVRDELVKVVRSGSLLELANTPPSSQNLYQAVCALLARRPYGLTLEELQWHLERFYGLPLDTDALQALLDPFEELIDEEGHYRLPEAALAELQPVLGPATSEEMAGSWHQKFERRLQALEAKVEMLVDLLAKRMNNP